MCQVPTFGPRIFAEKTAALVQWVDHLQDIVTGINCIAWQVTNRVARATPAMMAAKALSITTSNTGCLPSFD
jgi:hypothetical protein